MCLLIDHPATVEFSSNDIEDFFIYNSDGIGVMYTDGTRVVVEKFLPTSAEDAWKFYVTHVRGRDCALHFRQKTHGLIDMENCHPYAVPDTEAWVMHNGVLSIGNDKDPTKSDTWHYVRNYLQPLLMMNPDIVFVSAFQDMLGAHIDSGNRFIITTPKGRVIINEHHGITHKGAWLSNTYAWSAPVYKPRYNITTSPGWIIQHDIPNLCSADSDAMEYFFEVLENAALWDAYGKLTCSAVEMAIEKLGVDAFYNFCDWIMDSSLDDTAVIDYIHHPEDIPSFGFSEAA